MLAARIGDLCRHLFANGVRCGHEFRVGSLDGQGGQSLGIHLDGPRAGVWQDFASGEAGDALDLVARALFGVYQGGFAEYGPWPELADRTKADRVQQGYPENDPLLREGDLRDGIGIAYGPSRAEIGSNDDVMVYQELGTETIPPRPVLGLTGTEEEKAVFEMVGDGVVKALIR